IHIDKMLIEINPERLPIALCLLGGFIICFGLVSYFIKERLFLSEALVSVIAGIILGPKVLGLLHSEDWGSNDIIHGFTRTVIAIQSIYGQRNEILDCSIDTCNELHVAHKWIGYLANDTSYYLEALLLASCVTPTDPVLANSVVKGKFAELFIMGFMAIIGSDDLLACFIAGTSFTWDDWFRRETEEAHLQEVIDLLLNIAVFVYIGFEEYHGSNISESTTIEIISPREDVEYQKDDSSEIHDSYVHDVEPTAKRDSRNSFDTAVTRSSHDLNLDQIRGYTSRQPHEININIPHDISKRRQSKAEKIDERSRFDHDQLGPLSSKYAIWDEGDNYIIENYEGEDIRVIPSPYAHHRNREGESGGRVGERKWGNWNKLRFFKMPFKKSKAEDKENKENAEDKENKENAEDKENKENAEDKENKEKDVIKDDRTDNGENEGDESGSKGGNGKGKNKDTGEMG
ncbi:16698_t:CDS:2, partial [Acaulospora colombiana]